MNFKLVMVLAWLNPGTGIWDMHKEYTAYENWPPSVQFPDGRPIVSRGDCILLSRFLTREYKSDGAKVMYVDCAGSSTIS